MQSKFLDRFSVNSEGRWQEGFKGVPVNKAIKSSQIHHPFSSAGRSVIDSQNFPKNSIQKYSLKSSSTREHYSKFDLDGSFDIRPKFKLRDYTSSTPVPRKATGHEKMYKEYSLAEYKNLKPKQYYVLGGLGSSIIGTNEWIHAREKLRRIRNYGQILRRNNNG